MTTSSARTRLLGLTALLVACTRTQATPPAPAAVDASAPLAPVADASAVTDAAEDARDAEAATLPPAPDDVCGSIYLLAKSGDFLRFSPTMKGLSRVGHPSCPLGEDGLRSLAVDRSGKAWVPALDGRIAEVNVHDATCTMTPFAAHQGGFATVNLTLAGTTLYGADDHGWGGDVAPSLGLATIDRATWKLTPVHKTTSRMHLAGAPGGALYAASPGAVEELARGTYKATDLKLVGLEKGPGAPMAFHKGALWFFSQSGVMRFDLGTKTMKKVLPALGVLIDGAGGASCP